MKLDILIYFIYNQIIPSLFNKIETKFMKTLFFVVANMVPGLMAIDLTQNVVMNNDDLVGPGGV